MVNQGAIDEELFNASGGEIVFVYGKIANFIPQLREFFGAPELLQHMETLVKRIPNIDERITQMNERMKKFGEMRAQMAAKAQAQAAS